MQHRLSVYPDLTTAEFEPLLEAELARRGRSVLERIVHADGEVHPRLSQRLAAHGDGAEALTFHQPTSGDGIVLPPSVVLRHAAGDGGAGSLLPLARAMSQAAGGWSLAMAASRNTERYALGAFLAGRTIEASVFDGATAVLRFGVEPGERADLADEASAWSAFASLYRAVAFGQAADLHWASARAPLRSWIASAAAPGTDALAAALGRGEPDLRRAVFVDASAARLEQALASAGWTAGDGSARLRLIERRAPLTGAPYALLDGDFDDAAFVALARRLDAPAAAVEMRGDEQAFTWCTVDASGQVQAGCDRGAARLAQVWQVLAATLGEPASIVRWPQRPAEPAARLRR